MQQFVVTRKNMMESINDAEADTLKDSFQKAGTVNFVLLTNGGSMLVEAENIEEVENVMGDKYSVFISTEYNPA
ncbi:MAG: hypothetical protein GC136_02435 [Alphaproteobacteria bacterium]|nr:hypothetical protein [Alphaproteobacteria bacterium]